LAIYYYNKGNISKAFYIRDPSIFGNTNLLYSKMLLDSPKNKISYIGTRGGTYLNNIILKAIREDKRF
jgi:hypothetical protein